MKDPWKFLYLLLLPLSVLVAAIFGFWNLKLHHEVSSLQQSVARFEVEQKSNADRQSLINGIYMQALDRVAGKDARIKELEEALVRPLPPRRPPIPLPTVIAGLIHSRLPQWTSAWKGFKPAVNFASFVCREYPIDYQQTFVAKEMLQRFDENTKGTNRYISPDGNRVAYISCGQTPDSEVHVFDRQRGFVSQIAFAGTLGKYWEGFWLDEEKFLVVYSNIPVDLSPNYHIYDFSRNIESICSDCDAFECPEIKGDGTSLKDYQNWLLQRYPCE